MVTVPAYFNQAERRAVLHAAKMADLKVLQLIDDNTAVALNYGVFRRKDINATAQVPLERGEGLQNPCRVEGGLFMESVGHRGFRLELQRLCLNLALLGGFGLSA